MPQIDFFSYMLIISLFFILLLIIYFFLSNINIRYIKNENIVYEEIISINWIIDSIFNEVW